MNNPMAVNYPFSLKIPPGDDRKRMVCDDCGWVHYVNPKIVVGSVGLWDDRILLCRRAIEPRRGYWTIPAGYLEEHETAEAGAMREAREEAQAEIVLEGLIGVYSVPRISQVQLIYKARLLTAAIACGPESLDVALFAWDAIPWDALAFPSVRWALGHYREIGGEPTFAPRTNPAGETGNY